MPRTIDRFTGEYRFLSNFYPCKIKFGSEIYPSVEHAYQAAKTKIKVNRKKLTDETLPAGKAKKIGRTFKLRDDWEDIRVKTMYQLVRKKFFDHPHLAKKLIKTQGTILVEGNNWGDNFWGVCDKEKGKNVLGHILMIVRGELIHGREQ